MRDTLKNKKGITLIALIITIIIMLILAGVAISAITDGEGLFNRARLAVDKYNQVVEDEADKITSLMNEIDKHLNGVQTSSVPKGPDGLAVKISEGMVPVVYNTEDTSWYVATEEQVNNGTWHNYIDTSASGQANKSQWANVMLRDNLQVEGVSNANTVALAEIYGKKVTSEGSMYVYIPRYAYKITSNLHNGGSGIAGDIEIVFIDTNNKNGNMTYNTTYPATSDIGTTNGRMDNFVVHPTFNWVKENGASVQLEGVWVGKFEASMADESYSNINTTSDNIGNKITSSSVILRTVGNVSAWRCVNVNNLFLNCYNMNNAENALIYGISTNKDIIDPHLIKNTEWGAVAYLAHSKYGRNKIEDESMSNLSAEYLTGNGDYRTNVMLSTTGNIYGIYDMAGGAYECVAAYVDSTNNGTIENEGLTDETYGKSLYDAEEKYKNVYTIGTTDTKIDNYTANADKYGVAIYETSTSNINTSPIDSWNSDRSVYPFSNLPFFIRGASINYTGMGIFAFGQYERICE